MYNDISYIVSSTATQYFKTDNLLINVTMSIIIMLLADFIMRNNSGNFLEKIFNFFRKQPNSEYVIHAQIILGHDDRFSSKKFPKEYIAVIYILDKLNINLKTATQYKSNKNKTSKKHFYYLLESTKDIHVTPDIKIWAQKLEDSSKERTVIYKNYYIHVTSNRLAFKELREVITSWVAEYDKYTIENDIDSQYYFTYLGAKPNAHKERLAWWEKDPDANEEETMNFDFYNFKSNKKFDNIFFEGKEDLITRINFFLESEDKYKELGIPYMLGLLFYGEPGCGKTSTIKAICNMTKRHLVEIPLSKIKTCRELKQIILGERIEGKYVPQNKRIIIFEDMDCMLDVLLDREYKEEKKEDPNGSSSSSSSSKDKKENLIIQVNTSDKAETFDSKSDKDGKDPVTLSFILNLIDGVHEQPGRIIVFTTNYPEKLDKALLRSGRIDMKVNFKKCSTKICKDILEFYFKTKIKNLENCDYKKTPAELMELCMNYNDLDKILEKLRV